MRKSLIFITGFFTISSFSQSAWTQKRGEVYTQISYSIISNYTSLYGNPDYATERKITDNTLQLYGEYGLSDKTTAILGIPIKFLEAGGLSTQKQNPLTTADSKTALGNFVFGIKQHLYSKSWIVSAQLNVEAATGSFNKNSGLRSGYDSWSFSPTLNIGRSFKGFFAQAFTGFDLRLNGYSSNLKLGAEIGASPFKPILLIGYLNATRSFKNGDIQLSSSNLLTGLYVNNQEYMAFGIKAIGNITPRYGILMGYAGALSGNNVPKREVFSFGTFYKF